MFFFFYFIFCEINLINMNERDIGMLGEGECMHRSGFRHSLTDLTFRRLIIKLT